MKTMGGAGTQVAGTWVSHWPFKSGSVDSVVFPGSLMERERGTEKDPIVYAVFSMGA